MRFFSTLLQAGLLASATTSAVAASWTFTDATVSVQGRGSGVGNGLREKIQPNKPLTKPIDLSASETLKIILTTQEGKSAKRAHQAFLLLRDPTSNLDISFPLSVKESGKAKVDLTQKDLPPQFLRSSTPISASVVIASFGSSTGYNSQAFRLNVVSEAGAPNPASDKPLRYGKQPEIHHIFRADPKSGNALLSVIFAAAALATLPVLLGGWLFMGGNLNHLSKAFSDAPVSHGLFVSSIVGLEGVLFLYYTSWNLFQTLPVLLGVGTVTFLSGSRALTEVQERRLAGLR